MRREAMRAHSHGVRTDSALCLLQYARLKLSKPGLASWPWHHVSPSLCQCQLQLGWVPAANARLSLACGKACALLLHTPNIIASFLPRLRCHLCPFLCSLFCLARCNLFPLLPLMYTVFPAWYGEKVLAESLHRLLESILWSCLVIALHVVAAKTTRLFNFI